MVSTWRFGVNKRTKRALSVLQEKMDKQEEYQKRLIELMSKYGGKPIEGHEDGCFAAIKSQKEAFQELNVNATFKEWIDAGNFISWRDRPNVKKRIYRAAKKSIKNS